MTQAINRPNGKLINAASAAAPKLRRSAATTRGSVSDRQRPSKPSSHGRRASAASGSRTINDTQRSVILRVARKPGSTEAEREAQVRSFTGCENAVEHAAVSGIPPSVPPSSHRGHEWSPSSPSESGPRAGRRR